VESGLFRLLAPVVLPSLFAGAVLGVWWAVFNGPGGVRSWLLVVVFLLVGLAVGEVWAMFLLAVGWESVGWLVSGFAAATLVISVFTGADQWLLQDRGRETTCGVLAIDGPDASAIYHYRLDCAGGGPSSMLHKGPIPHVMAGQSIRVRYDPADSATTTLSSEASNGRTALMVAGVALAVLILVGILGPLLGY
jgi:hypothetical protein